MVALLLFFDDTAPTEIYTLSLHGALPIWPSASCPSAGIDAWKPASSTAPDPGGARAAGRRTLRGDAVAERPAHPRSEEHTSELQSRQYLVCRLLLEKKHKSPRAHSYRLSP